MKIHEYNDLINIINEQKASAELMVKRIRIYQEDIPKEEIADFLDELVTQLKNAKSIVTRS